MSVTARGLSVEALRGQRGAGRASRQPSDDETLAAVPRPDRRGLRVSSDAQRETVIWRDADEAGAKYAGDVAKALGAIGVAEVKIITPPEGAAPGWDAADALAEGWTPARALALVMAARPAAQALHGVHGSPPRPPADGSREEDKAQGHARGSDGRRGRRPPPQRNHLVKIGEAAGLWHSPEREGFATVEVERHVENWPLRSRDFRYWLAGRYYDETGGAPGGQALADALGILEQMAIRGPEHQPHRRVAGADGKVYLDLGDPTRRQILTGAPAAAAAAAVNPDEAGVLVGRGRALERPRREAVVVPDMPVLNVCYVGAHDHRPRYLACRKCPESRLRR